MDNQKTIAKEVSLKGVGLHTGNPVNLAFKPAEIDAGINFIRTDLPSHPVIKASVEQVVSLEQSPRRTSIRQENIQVQTIEHLMSALFGLGIDNLYIEIDNEEVPGLDGSSLNFLNALNSAGLIEQEKARHYYAIKEPVSVEDDGSSIIALPSLEL
ncbi:MAG TPA: UDP-3-O-acyl-N-acetylglucosamine deacetylase, partial [Candidatus Omnitrophota bacterium]|nr:UDP-3-O-acyl-N-acetylglucosamine deacetylase [Candidatus Omnitrophota bacterium]